MTSFDPSKDIPSLAGKVILVTGGSGGLGEACVAAYARHRPARILLAARSKAKAEAAMSRIGASLPDASMARCIEFVELDLASLASVRAAGERILARQERLDIVQLNGGVAGVPAARTSDGYEIHFGTNFLGHAALVQLLMPLLLRTAEAAAHRRSDVDGGDVRLVWISSAVHSMAPKGGIDFDSLKTDFSQYNGSVACGNSMLAKNLFANQLMRRYGNRGIHATSVHPGIVKTNVWNGEKGVNMFMKMIFKLVVTTMGVDVEEGTKTQLWASVSKEAANGMYYVPIGKTGQESKLSYDEALGNKLWDWTRDELKAQGFPGWQ